MTNQNITVRLSATGEKAVKDAFEGISNSAGGLVNSLKRVGEIAIGFTIGTAITKLPGFLSSATNEAIAEEASIKKLETAINNAAESAAASQTKAQKSRAAAFADAQESIASANASAQNKIAKSYETVAEAQAKSNERILEAQTEANEKLKAAQADLRKATTDAEKKRANERIKSAKDEVAEVVKLKQEEAEKLGKLNQEYLDNQKEISDELAKTTAKANVKMADSNKELAEATATANRVAGQSWDALKDKVLGVIDTSMELGFTDDETRDALALLVAQTDDAEEAMRRLALAQDLSRGANIDLYTASKLLGKVTDENINVLGRYGISVEKGSTETELFAAVYRKFHGQASEFADTTAGKMARLKIQMGELKEDIGEALIPVLLSAGNVMLNDVVPAIRDAIEIGKKKFNEIGPVILDQLDGPARKAWDALKSIKDMIPELTHLLKLGFEGGEIGGDFNIIEKAAFGLGQELAKLKKFLDENGETIFLSFRDGLKAASDAFISFGDYMIEHKDLLAGSITTLGVALALLNPIMAATGALLLGSAGLIFAIGLLHQKVEEMPGPMLALRGEIDKLAIKFGEFAEFMSIFGLSELIGIDSWIPGLSDNLRAFREDLVLVGDQQSNLEQQSLSLARAQQIVGGTTAELGARVDAAIQSFAALGPSVGMTIFQYSDLITTYDYLHGRQGAAIADYPILKQRMDELSKSTAIENQTLLEQGKQQDIVNAKTATATTTIDIMRGSLEKLSGIIAKPKVDSSSIDDANRKMDELIAKIREIAVNAIDVITGFGSPLRGITMPQRNYQTGTPYVPKDMLAYLHKGEAVIPASRNMYADGQQSIVINIDKVMATDEATARVSAQTLSWTLLAEMEMRGLKV